MSEHEREFGWDGPDEEALEDIRAVADPHYDPPPATAPRWSPDPPQEPGWYWVQRIGAQVAPVIWRLSIEHGFGPWWSVSDEPGHATAVRVEGVEFWPIPITPPEATA